MITGRILLVEDHEPTLSVMTKLLRCSGHRVTGVTTVASAIAAAGADHGEFDVIILSMLLSSSMTSLRRGTAFST